VKITCPNCASDYEVDDGALGPAGRKVRCVSCQTIWLAGAPEFSEPAQEIVQPQPVLPPELVMSGFADEAPEPAASQPAPEPEEARFAKNEPIDNSADLDAWIAIASEPQLTEAASNDQNSIDSLFDDAPAETAEEEPQAEPEAAPEENLPAETVIAPPKHPMRMRRGLVNAHIGDFRTKRSRRAPLIAASIALVLGGAMALVAFRETIVGFAPQVAGIYSAFGMNVNLRGLEVVNIGSELSEADGIPVLIVRGEIVNPGREPRDMPPVFLGVLDEAGKQLYGWSVMLEQKSVEPGAVIPFRRRLASPPAEARKVMVRFLMDGDPKPAGGKEPGMEASPPADGSAKDKLP
jgi:predicted Zn finger-like uncharacterized protein